MRYNDPEYYEFSGRGTSICYHIEEGATSGRLWD
jgi:hypothetical protein